MNDTDGLFIEREFKENLHVSLNNIRGKLNQGCPTSNHLRPALYLGHCALNRSVKHRRS
jgi:hypothetical protein